MILMDCNERLWWLSGFFFLHVFTLSRDRGDSKWLKKCFLRRALSSLLLKERGSFFSGHRSFVYSFILLSVLLHLYSLPPFCSLLAGGCQSRANSSWWRSIVRARPGVVCLCLCSVMQCAGAWRSEDEADWDGSSLIKGVKLLLPPLCYIEYGVLWLNACTCVINACICLHLPYTTSNVAFVLLWWYLGQLMTVLFL